MFTATERLPANGENTEDGERRTATAFFNHPDVHRDFRVAPAARKTRKLTTTRVLFCAYKRRMGITWINGKILLTVRLNTKPLENKSL
jgi:hypothetical protein